MSGNWPDRKSIGSLVVPIAILALVIGTTLGEVWHRHVNTSPENCPICHLSHQAVEPAVASVRSATLVPDGDGPELLQVILVRGHVVRRVPARAPPV